MISRNKFDKLIHKISSAAGKKLYKNSSVNLSNDNLFVPTPEDIKELKSKNLNLLTKIEILEDKLEKAIFPVEIEKLKHNILIIDSSAVTRAKLKKLFDQDNCHVFLPRDMQDVDITINELLSKMETVSLIIVEYSEGNNAVFGMNFIELLEQGKWNINPILYASCSSDSVTIKSNHFPHINGLISKPWDEESMLAKFSSLLK